MINKFYFLGQCLLGGEAKQKAIARSRWAGEKAEHFINGFLGELVVERYLTECQGYDIKVSHKQNLIYEWYDSYQHLDKEPDLYIGDCGYDVKTTASTEIHNKSKIQAKAAAEGATYIIYLTGFNYRNKFSEDCCLSIETVDGAVVLDEVQIPWSFVTAVFNELKA